MAELSTEVKFPDSELTVLDKLYEEKFGEGIPLFTSTVAHILANKDYQLSIEGYKRLEKEVFERIENNDPFEVPEGYWDWMW